MADKEIQLFGDTAFCALHTEKDGGVVRIQRRATAFERDLTERFGDGIALTGKGALPFVLRRFGAQPEAVSVKMSESKTDVSVFFMRRVSSSF